jgi:hypothetical protein
MEEDNKKKSIGADNLILYNRMQKYRTKKRGDEIVYDLAKAEEEDEYVKYYFDKYLRPYGKGRVELSIILFKLERAIKKGYLEFIEPLNDSDPYITIRKIFGNIKTFNSLFGEIIDLISNGQSLEKHSRRLERKYHLRKAIILDMWTWTQREFFNMDKKDNEDQ